ncbi:hypothetical protein [Glycomyces salinus]|uniref:hypothetical protein n=1 Tax=Glycomyces salinus TaxID=980294 RepID=UPI0018ED7B0A|nr:hypothetical protein [Glycomyces salinus]
MDETARDAAYYLALAVHGFLSGQVAGWVDTAIETDDTGRTLLIAGDVDALLEAIVEHGNLIADAGHEDLVRRARALAEAKSDAAAAEALALLDQLGSIAGIEWDQFLPLPIPNAATLEQIAEQVDRGDGAPS